MLDSVVSAILEKGGLGYALFLGAVFIAGRILLRNESRESALQQQISDLQSTRVADAQKTRDDVVGVNRQLVEVLTLNKAALDETNAVMGQVLERFPEGTDARRRSPDETGSPKRAR